MIVSSVGSDVYKLRGSGQSIRYVFVDAVDNGSKAEKRSEGWVARAALGAGIHFDAILLLPKGYSGRVRV